MEHNCERYTTFFLTVLAGSLAKPHANEAEMLFLCCNYAACGECRVMAAESRSLCQCTLEFTDCRSFNNSYPLRLKIFCTCKQNFTNIYTTNV